MAEESLANFSTQSQVVYTLKSCMKQCGANIIHVLKMVDSGRYLLYSFVVNFIVHRYHKYKEIWPDPIVGELPCERVSGVFSWHMLVTTFT